VGLLHATSRQAGKRCCPPQEEEQHAVQGAGKGAHAGNKQTQGVQAASSSAAAYQGHVQAAVGMPQLDPRLTRKQQQLQTATAVGV
jgi:hypothetical protein